MQDWCPKCQKVLERDRESCRRGMRGLYRSLCPIGIYIAITYAVRLLSVIAVFLVMCGVMAADSNGFNAMEFAKESREIYKHSVLLITFVSALVAIPILTWLYKRDTFERGAAWKKPEGPPKFSGYLVLFSIGVCIAGNTLINMAKLYLTNGGRVRGMEQITAASLLVQFLGVVCVIPVAEELTFRALGFCRLRDEVGFWASATISSLCFGIFHGNWTQGTYAFILGVGICFVYESYRTVLAPIMVHCVANLVSTLLNLTHAGKFLFGSAPVMGASFGVAVFAAAVCAVFIYRQVYRANHQSAAQAAEKEENL